MLDVFRLAQNNILGILILLIIFLNIRLYIRRALVDQRLFLGMMISTAIIMFIDIILISIDGRGGTSVNNISTLLTSFYFILNPLPFFIWTLYVDFEIYQDEKVLKKLFIIAIWPVIINTVLSISSIFYGLVFFIDDNNMYNRGPWFWVISAIYYCYSLYAVINIIKNRNYISNKKYYSMLLFIVPPFIGGLVQILIPGIKFLWISLSISLMMVFINIQKEQLYTDQLTGLYNRRHLEAYLKDQRNMKTKRNMGMLMIDIDCFKKINDTFGHVEGDRALEYFSQTLRDSFRKSDTIFRYAGDEFVVIMEVRNTEELEKAVNRMKKNIKKFNDEKITPYEINVSVGYDVLNHSANLSMKAFIKHIDQLMYKEKLINCENK